MMRREENTINFLVVSFGSGLLLIGWSKLGKFGNFDLSS
jgi:hypothetical protein